MARKKLAKALLYPHRAIIISLLPISAVLLIISFVFIDSASPVSIITLESTMLTTFGKGGVDELTRKIYLALTGAAVAIFIITVAIYVITVSTKKLTNITNMKENKNGK